jgi:uncharacterized membrane protein
MGGAVFIVLALVVYVMLALAGSRRRISALEDKVERLERSLRPLLTARAEREAPAPLRLDISDLELDLAEVEEPRPASTRPAPARGEATHAEETPVRETRAEPPPFLADAEVVRARGTAPATEARPADTSEIAETTMQVARAWLLGGNTVARVGVVILFFGVAFSLKYAVEQGWFPIELRLAAAALAGMTLVLIGWRQRERRRDYGLVLQGGGTGIVYLTVFAAVDLYHLLPAGPGLVLMVVLVLLASALAVLQDARSLAVLAIVGGFLAPVLVSRGGSHVQLFSYYLVLNAGILGIAWFKAWRELNLIGFLFTFVIAGAWGYRFYRPEYFDSTEPFLVLFFLLYVAVPVLFARREPTRLGGYVDGPLVFGVPLVAFGLQSGLVRGFEYGLALSALAAGLFYAFLASTLWRRKPETMHPLTEAFLALAVVFGTLAIPLAVDARWTGAAWALEGAALVWVGVRQRRMLARGFGLLVQIGAGVSFLSAATRPVADVPVLNSFYLGALMVSLAGLFSAYQIYRQRAVLKEGEATLSALVLGWGLVWWYGSSLTEIWRHVSADNRYNALLVLVVASSVVLSLLSRSLHWTEAGRPPLLLLPIMASIALLQFGFQLAPHLFAHWGWAAWGAAFIGNYWLLHRHEVEGSRALIDTWHTVTLWLAVFIVGWEAWWVVAEMVPEGPTWRYLTLGLVPTLVILILPRLALWLPWPLQEYHAAYFERGLAPLVVVAALWVLHASLQTGKPTPLPYLLLCNPLELGQGLVLVVIFREVLKRWGWVSPQVRWRALLLLGFVALNGVIARATHFLGGVPFELGALWASPRYQTAVSISWTLVSLAAMAGATRLHIRPLWVAGAGLLSAVVAKLFLVDLVGIGTVARIVSFIAVGVLVLVIGYLSPLPPRSEEQSNR